MTMVTVVVLKLLHMIKKRGCDGVPYRELAKNIGISHVALWKLLNQQLKKERKPYNPSLEMLDKLCRFFKCKPGDILEYVKGDPHIYT